jgi:phosphomannomutase
MMVTASHNPATESGVKLFDHSGRKSMPEKEDDISRIAWGLVAVENRRKNSNSDSQDVLEVEEIDGLRNYRMGLKARLATFENLCGLKFNAVGCSGVVCSSGLLLDSSGGSAAGWLAAGLQRRGLQTEEVSDLTRPINHNCGAGGLSPTDKWSLQQLVDDEQQHLLLGAIAERLEQNDGMPFWGEGELVGAALDGDADRCLLLAGALDGLFIIDGDRIADDMLRVMHSSSGPECRLAASIESDLGLLADLNRFEPHIKGVTTAVGDRWLAEALEPSDATESQLHSSTDMPLLIGCEDSGHIVLPAADPITEQRWQLVGDGAATLIAYLLTRAALNTTTSAVVAPFAAGWKARRGIMAVERSRWNGTNALATEVQRLAQHWLQKNATGVEWVRQDIPGESEMLFLTAQIDGVALTVGVRNSGTESKISVSLRCAAGWEAILQESELYSLLNVVASHLQRAMVV